MYILYVDESGDTSLTGGSKHLILGAAALFEGEWRWLRSGLQSLLEKYFPSAADRPAEIHCSDIRRGKHEFSKISKEQRLQLLLDACSYVAKFSAKQITLFSVIYDKPWWRLRNPGKSGDDLYIEAFENLVSRFDYFLKRRHSEGQSTKGLIVADPRSTAFCKALRDTVLRFHASGTRWAKLENIVESVLFLASHESPGLQIADLCSYSSWRLVEYGDGRLAELLMDRFDREPAGSEVHPGRWHGVRYYGAEPSVASRVRALWT